MLYYGRNYIDLSRKIPPTTRYEIAYKHVKRLVSLTENYGFDARPINTQDEMNPDLMYWKICIIIYKKDGMLTKECVDCNYEEMPKHFTSL